MRLTEDEIQSFTLAEIEKILNQNGKSLKDFPGMPLVDRDFISDLGNTLMQTELNYNRAELSTEHDYLFEQLTDEQKNIYKSILDATNDDAGGLFFVYGYGGTGKTFIWRSLSAALRCKGEIVLNVASSGIASLLLPGGRTAHSRFSIPLSLNENSTCNIRQNTLVSQLIAKAKLIIWDEAPMVHKHCFEALDRTLRDILRFTNPSSSELPFGGKVVVLGGDFRQILPVIPNGRREDIVLATINSSYLWNHCKVLTLTRNMRLEINSTASNMEETKAFADWILKIGDGNVKVNNDGEEDIEIPDEFIVKYDKCPLQAIASAVYSSFGQEFQNPRYFEDRAILAPKNDDVDMINGYMLSLMPGEEREYLSSDSICKTDSNSDSIHDIHSVEFLNTIRCSGVPNHILKLKVGAPVMLMRNIDQTLGLCNGTRLVVTQLGKHVIECKVLSGKNIGHKVFIPRMTISPSDTKLPFKFQRRQFPLMLSFAMTINKSQGQSLSQVGLYLRQPVFSHGQLYVALSRAKSRKSLKVLIVGNDGSPTNMTKNVVYKEIFQNLV